VLLCEKAFDADKFNPFTRYSIDIRDILPRAITKLQKTLSKKKYDTFWDCGREDVYDPESYNIGYEMLDYYKSMVDSYPLSKQEDVESGVSMWYNPQPIVQQIEEKTIRGVECKIGFYINDHTIVERMFYVDGFNPIARWSVDIFDAVVEITESIFDKIKGSDVKNMWDDYDLINVRGLNINQIRELSPAKREEMLRRLRR
jgi:hypothetical protein